MERVWEELREQLGTIADLDAACAVLGWDQETYLPEAGIEARATQLTTLARLSHQLFTADEIGRLLETLEAEVDPEGDSDEARLLKVTRRDRDRAIRLPAELVAELARAASLGQRAWQEARESDDFGHFRPHLQRLVELSVEKAEVLGFDGHPYDALLDEYEPEMTAAKVREVFDRLRRELVPIVEILADQPPIDDACLHRHFAADAQWDFGLRVMGDFGFDFARGRQDRSAHPFTTSLSVDDVRLTTRIQEDYLPSALFGSLHECGHGLYEQGVDPALERTPLAGGASLGVHESQSRLWENLVGRSREFWSHYWPLLREVFSDGLGGVQLDDFHRAVNRVEPSLIRVEADEVTYNLHIMLRFELECALLEGDVEVGDLPDLWNARMEDYLGVVPDSDANGVLQDIHWSMGAIGYFPTYTLGNLISVQLFDRAAEELDGLRAQIAQGEFDELLGWLRQHIHRHGRKYTAAELLRRVTGDGLDAEPWLRYVRRKFGEVYGVEL